MSSKNDTIRSAIRTGVRQALQEEASTEQSGRGRVKNAIRQAVREVLSEDDDYQAFVKATMNKLNVDSPQDFTEEGREAFFNLLDDNYNANSDEADEVSRDDLESEMSPEHYKDKSKCPDFLKKNEQVEEAARRLVRKVMKNL